MWGSGVVTVWGVFWSRDGVGFWSRDGGVCSGVVTVWGSGVLTAECVLGS